MRSATSLSVGLSVLVAAVNGPTPAIAQSKHQALVDSVTSDSVAAPKLRAQEIVAGTPESAPPIVGEVVGALPAGPPRLSLAPRVVSAAIAALPADQRAPLAPGCACAAIRAVPPAEQGQVVPLIIAAAVAIAPTARLPIAKCATEVVPTLVQAINAAEGAGALQAEMATPPLSPLPRSTIGAEVLFSNRPQAQICASPPCP